MLRRWWTPPQPVDTGSATDWLRCKQRANSQRRRLLVPNWANINLGLHGAIHGDVARQRRHHLWCRRCVDRWGSVCGRICRRLWRGDTASSCRWDMDPVADGYRFRSRCDQYAIVLHTWANAVDSRGDSAVPECVRFYKLGVERAERRSGNVRVISPAAVPTWRPNGDRRAVDGCLRNRNAHFDVQSRPITIVTCGIVDMRSSWTVDWNGRGCHLCRAVHPSKRRCGRPMVSDARGFWIVRLRKYDRAHLHEPERSLKPTGRVCIV
eukprot:COSAG01_NODE_10278_length_2202_cov_2.810271_2_plen_266_part_00